MNNFSQEMKEETVLETNFTCSNSTSEFGSSPRPLSLFGKAILPFSVVIDWVVSVASKELNTFEFTLRDITIESLFIFDSPNQNLSINIIRGSVEGYKIRIYSLDSDSGKKQLYLHGVLSKAMEDQKSTSDSISVRPVVEKTKKPRIDPDMQTISSDCLYRKFLSNDVSYREDFKLLSNITTNTTQSNATISSAFSINDGKFYSASSGSVLATAIESSMQQINCITLNLEEPSVYLPSTIVSLYVDMKTKFPQRSIAKINNTSLNGSLISASIEQYCEASNEICFSINKVQLIKIPNPNRMPKSMNTPGSINTFGSNANKH